MMSNVENATEGFDKVSNTISHYQKILELTGATVEDYRFLNARLSSSLVDNSLA
jgi:hypothetical protein